MGQLLRFVHQLMGDCDLTGETPKKPLIRIGEGHVLLGWGMTSNSTREGCTTHSVTTCMKSVLHTPQARQGVVAA